MIQFKFLKTLKHKAREKS